MNGQSSSPYPSLIIERPELLRYVDELYFDILLKARLVVSEETETAR
jgi:hypothetical protein